MTIDRGAHKEREYLLRLLSAATFLIFFQAYAVAPLIPRLSAVFRVSAQTIGLIVPAYMIPGQPPERVHAIRDGIRGRVESNCSDLIAFSCTGAVGSHGRAAQALVSRSSSNSEITAGRACDEWRRAQAQS